jgi:hypothetical protein
MHSKKEYDVSYNNVSHLCEHLMSVKVMTSQ